MPRPPKSGPSAPADTTPRPRASRGKSGKPAPPPVERAGGTPETRRSARGLAEASAPFLPAPAARARWPRVGEGETETSALGVPPNPGPSPQGGGEPHRSTLPAAPSTLPALRQVG